MQNALLNPYHEVLRQKEAQFAASIENGEISPFIFPRDLAPLGVLILALMIKYPRNGALRYTRHLAFLVMSYLAFGKLKKCRILGLGNGYGVGLFIVWMVSWGGAYLVFNDAQRDFRRIERYVVSYPKKEEIEKRANGNGSAAIDISSREQSNLRPRALPGTAKRLPVDSQQTDITASPPKKMRVFRWQGYPESITHRLGWVLDLVVFNVRGPGWNWRISSLPALPKFIPKDDDIYTEPAQDNRAKVDQAVSHLWTNSILFAISYLGFDVCKVLMMRDPYFWGELASLPPDPYGKFLTISPFLVRTYRITLSIFGILSSLIFFPSLTTLVVLGLSILFPRTQDWISVPLDAAWMYPRAYGRFPQDFYNRGIAGFWGLAWHQLFRFGFTEPSRWLVSHLPISIQCRTMRRMITLFTGFAISGALHACGSYTQIGSTNPLSGPFTFFVIQAPAILAQQFCSESIIPLILPFRSPLWLSRLTNACVLVGWILLSASRVIDDFANGGTWLMEPVPISVVRGLGFGRPGEGWWCWDRKWFKWWTGEHWWDSGIQIL